MPEEKYRTMCDHLSDVIYAYFDEYKEQGVNEGLNPNNIVVTGNIIVDVLNENYWNKFDDYNQFADISYFESKGLLKGHYFIMTCHRRENISSVDNLNYIFDLVKSVKEKVYFPAGYRTQKYINKFNLELPKNLIMVDPIGYKDIITLMVNSNGVLTDSGTIVEEACVLQVPSVQMRTSTERPQVYDANSSVKFDPTSHDPEQIKGVMKKFRALPKKWNHNLGDGNASRKIASDISRRVTSNQLNGHLKENYHIPTDRAYSS